MHILAIEYLEKGAHQFTKVKKDNRKINKDGGKVEIVFDLKKKSYKKGFT